MPVLNPLGAVRDSVWMRGILTMSAFLLEDEDSDGLAPIWVRWGVRHGGPRGMDFVDREVQAVYDEESASIREPESDATVETVWDWVPTLDPTADGRLSIGVTVDGVAAPSISVAGRAATPDALATLAPGTYRIAVDADGYDRVEVDREVLPGVTTRVLVSPAPRLAANVATEAAANIVQLSLAGGACANGIAVDAAAVVIDPSLVALGGVSLFGTEGLAMGATRESPEDGLTVIHASLPEQPAWTFASARAGMFAWAVYRPACGVESVDERVRIDGIEGNVARFDREISETALGGALVDRSGALIGSVAGPDRVTLLTSRAQRFVEAAILALNEESDDSEAQVAAGGGLPWKWIGGTGAAGALAALLLSGSDDGPSTGEIVVTIPGGE